MINPPIPIVVCILVFNNKVLLVRRDKGAYSGLIGLLGGRINKYEHISITAKRKMKEESGIICHFNRYLGVISQQMYEKKKLIESFIIHVCELRPKNITSSTNKNYSWYDLKNIKNFREQMIPSDIIIIDNMYLKKGKNYYNCIVEKIDNIHILRKIE
jgi:ADP-ribose pyrophosphatase YjhB (NUDIX family)